ncbi:isocitrate lyase/phosphoenolpyruvate mutase family protein [Sphaerisporangium sp. NPDC049002]|uniref:isocitrate lyase/PEP mutase family protein n=1 Tax=unclassified Sphaerisporangium TaxID=2630420 RepID=UPI0033EBB272
MNVAIDRFARFRALHHGERPLFLPNAWDHASASALMARGFTAIGTTSLGVAAAAGKPDGEAATREETVRLAEGLARLPALISVDIEGGFSDDPGRVAALAAGLAEAGVAGVNIEDGRADGTLTPPGRQCALITAIKQAVPGLFVNARTDTYWLGGGDPPSPRTTMDRAEAYLQAGADGIFVPGLDDERVITTLACGLDAPLNILFTPGGASFRRLAALGVRRVSCGSLLFRAAVHNAVELAWAVANDDVVPAGLPSYAQTQALASAFDAPSPASARPARSVFRGERGAR